MVSEENREKMSKQKRDRNLLAFTGAAAIAVLAVNFAIAAFNAGRKKHKKKGSLIISKLTFLRVLIAIMCNFAFCFLKLQIFEARMFTLICQLLKF